MSGTDNVQELLVANCLEILEIFTESSTVATVNIFNDLWYVFILFIYE